MEHFLQPSFFALGVYCLALLFALLFPPPPAVLAPLLTLLAAGVLLQATTWMWWMPLDASTHTLVVGSFYVGAVLWAPAWLLLATRFAAAQGHPSRLQRPWLVPGVIGSAALVGFGFLTSPWHELLITPRVGTFSEFHSLFWGAVFWGALVVAAASGVYLELAASVRSNTVRLRSLALLGSGLIVIGATMYQVVQRQDGALDVVQLVATAAMLMVFVGIYGTRLFALSPVGLYRAVEHQADGILLVDEHGLLLYANPASERILGSKELVLDAPVYPILAERLRPLHAPDRPIDAVALRRQLELESDPGAGEIFRIGDRWLRIAVTTIPGVGGRARARSLLLSDHSELHQATEQVREREAELGESEERYRVLFEESPLGVIVLDTDLRIISVNQALCELVGASGPLAVSGLWLPDCQAIGDLPVRALVEKALDTRRPVVAEHEWLSYGDHEVHARLQIAPLTNQDDEVVGIQGILEDVSEHRRLQDQLFHSQKMEAVGQLAGGIAHDFNNYLTVMLGNSEFLIGQVDENDDLFGPVSEIAEAAERSATLTRQLLTVSRKQVFQPRVVDLNGLVTEFDRMLRRVLGEHVTLETVLVEESVGAKLDASQMEVALLNLAINARDAMPDGGTLTLVTSTENLGEGDSRLPAGEPPGDYGVIEVTDTGDGIDPEALAHIFEPFYTTKEPGQGTGLGLATVYGIVRQCNGFIGVESARNKGTTFRVHLPRVEVTEEQTAARARPLPRGSGTILLVEDERRLRALARTILEEQGYTVLEAMDGQRALERLAAHEGDVDLLVTDVIMPGMSGVELASHLREALPGLGVVYMSGYVDRLADAERMREPGVVFLQKPFTPRQLLVQVSEQLQRRRSP